MFKEYWIQVHSRVNFFRSIRPATTYMILDKYKLNNVFENKTINHLLWLGQLNQPLI